MMAVVVMVMVMMMVRLPDFHYVNPIFNFYCCGALNRHMKTSLFVLKILWPEISMLNLFYFLFLQADSISFEEMKKYVRQEVLRVFEGKEIAHEKI